MQPINGFLPRIKKHLPVSNCSSIRTYAFEMTLARLILVKSMCPVRLILNIPGVQKKYFKPDRRRGKVQVEDCGEGLKVRESMIT